MAQRPSRGAVRKKPPFDPARAATLKGNAFSLTREYRLAPPPIVDTDASLRVRAERDRYLLEPQLDGHRVIVARTGDSTRIVASDMRDWSGGLTRIRRALLALPCDTIVFEAILCALDASGRPSFDHLRTLLATGSDAGVVLIACDLLRDGDADLRAMPLSMRRELLRARLASSTEPIVLGQTVDGPLDAALGALRSIGLWGLVAKLVDGPYPSSCIAISTNPTEPPTRPKHLSASPHVTNATKVLYPRDDISKADIFAYYRDVAPCLLPLMRQRPIVAQRWPDGIDDFTWYQHRVPPRAPDYLGAVMVEGNRRILIENEDALLWFVNQAALTFHGFLSRVKTLASPDWMMLDLDPAPETPWATTIEVALAVRKLLELLEVESVVKTSGQKGIHVLVPLEPNQDNTVVQELARRMAEMIGRLMPAATTIESDREKRKGRIYIDVTQGFVGKILVLPYCLRATDGAPVSTPIAWDEVTPKLDPKSFHLKTMRARLDARGDLAKPLLSGRADARNLLQKIIPR